VTPPEGDEVAAEDVTGHEPHEGFLVVGLGQAGERQDEEPPERGSAEKPDGGGARRVRPWSSRAVPHGGSIARLHARQGAAREPTPRHGGIMAAPRALPTEGRARSCRGRRKNGTLTNDAPLTRKILAAYLPRSGIAPGVIAAPFDPRGYLMNPSRGVCEATAKAPGPELIATHVEVDGLVPLPEALPYLAGLGIRRGDAVFALAGRIPELYVAALGTLKHGNVFCPLFSAFGPEPIRARMKIGRARVLATRNESERARIRRIVRPSE